MGTGNRGGSPQRLRRRGCAGRQAADGKRVAERGRGCGRRPALDEAKKFLDAYYYTDYDRERLKRWVAHGSPEECVEQILAFIEAGATTVTLRMAAYDQKGQFERVTHEMLPALQAALA